MQKISFHVTFNKGKFKIVSYFHNIWPVKTTLITAMTTELFLGECIINQVNLSDCPRQMNGRVVISGSDGYN